MLDNTGDLRACLTEQVFSSSICPVHKLWDFPGGSDGKESICNAGDLGSIPFRKIPFRRQWLPTLVFLPRESYGQRSLAGPSSCGCKESDMTEQLMLSYLHKLWRAGDQRTMSEISESRVATLSWVLSYQNIQALNWNLWKPMPYGQRNQSATITAAQTCHSSVLGCI